ncbi:hypothetical protein DMP17_44725 [Pseudonocardia sp. TMWB2A]
MVNQPRSLGRVMATNSALSLALPLTAVVTGPLLARALGAEGRGALVAVIAPTLFAASLVNLGLPTMCAFFGARGRRPRRTALSLAMISAAVLGGLTSVALILLAPVLLPDYRHYWSVYYGVCATLPAMLAVESLRASAQASGQYSTPIIERALAVGTRCLGVVVLFAFGALTVPTAAVATWGPGAVVVLLYTAFAIRTIRTPAPAPAPASVAVGADVSAGADRDEAQVGPMLRFAMLSWGGSVAGVLVLKLDQLMLVFLTSAAEIGYYIVAVSVSEIVVVAVVALREILTAQSASVTGPSLVMRTARLVLYGGLLVAAAGSVACPVLLPLLFGADFAHAVLPTQILLIGAVFSGVSIVLGAGLAGAGRPGLFSAAQAFGVVVTVVAMLLLAPRYGGIGAAAASSITYAATALVTILIYTRVASVACSDILRPARGDLAPFLRLARRLRAGRKEP